MNTRDFVRPLLLGASVAGALRAQTPNGPASPYVPGTTWERRTPAAIGMDAALLDSAIAFARANESRAPRNMEENHYRTFGREPSRAPPRRA